MSAELPGVVAEHIAAVNAFDTDRIVATFAPDAYVNDNRREIAGIDAIRKFVDKEFVGDRVTMEVREVVDHYGDVIVRARYDGDYDKTNLPDGVGHVQLLQRPRRQDRQPERDLQPALAVLNGQPRESEGGQPGRSSERRQNLPA